MGHCILILLFRVLSLFDLSLDDFAVDFCLELGEHGRLFQWEHIGALERAVFVRVPIRKLHICDGRGPANFALNVNFGKRYQNILLVLHSEE